MTDERSANAVDRRLGQRLRSRRLELGMSQERLAELIGVTFQQVQKYERGVNRIAASRLFEIAQAVDMSVAQFFDNIGTEGLPAHVSAAADDVLSTTEGSQLVLLFAQIKTKRVRARVLDLVRALVGEETDQPETDATRTGKGKRTSPK